MREPPTSGVPWRTPGDRTPIDMTLRETGSVSMMSRVMTCVRDACVHVDLRRFARHRHGFFERADFQVGVDRDDDFRRDVDVLAQHRAEAGEGKRQFVRAGPQRFDSIAPLIVGDHGADLFDNRRAGRFNCHAGEHTAGFVANLSNNLRLRVRHCRQQDRRCQHQHGEHKMIAEPCLH